MSDNDKLQKKEPLNPFEGSPLFTPSIPSVPETTHYPAKQRTPNEFGEIPFDLRYDRQAIYVEVELAPQLAALYDLLPGNKKSILNDVFREFIKAHEALLKERKDLVEKYTHQIKKKKGLE